MNDKISQYKSLIFWRNMLIFGSIFIAIIGWILIKIHMLWVLLPYAYVVGFVLFSKNHCPFCGYAFFFCIKKTD